MYLERYIFSTQMILNDTIQKVNEMASKIQKVESDIKSIEKENNILKAHNNKQYKDIKYLKEQLETKKNNTIQNEIDASKIKEKSDKKNNKKQETNESEVDNEISNMVDNIIGDLFSKGMPNNKSNPNEVIRQSFVIDMKTGKVIDTNNKDSKNIPKIIIGGPKGPMSFNPFSMLFGGKKKETENINNDDTEGKTQYDFSDLQKYEVEKIDIELNTINDLIKLSKKFKEIEKINMPLLKKVEGLHEFNGKYYGINIDTLIRLEKPLEKLNNMIGLTQIKSQILEMIMYYMQEFEKGTSNMLHTIIEGPPGVGKTELGKLFAEIYSSLGVIPSNKFKLVKRTDLIGEYVGHTGKKTQDAIDEAEGGVLFIDEAYSLGGGSEKSDTFSKECIDVLNQNLSENKKKLIVIIAGYKDQLETSFFSYNPGLRRRFPFKYTIEGYTPEETKNIYMKKLNDIKWKLDDNVDDKYLVSFFTKNKDNFKNFGGDIENFILNSKFVHSKRVFKEHPSKRKKLNVADFESAFERFKSNKKTVDNTIPIGMYL
jgi:AAA+ superfamily predicted ATPase